MDEISELLRKLAPEMGHGANASSPASDGGAPGSGQGRRQNLDRPAPPGLQPRSQRLQGAQAEPCELCGGAGFLLDDLPLGHPDYGAPVPCKCKLAERTQRRRSRFQGVNELDALARFTFDSFDPDLSDLPPDKRSTLAAAYDAATDFAEEPRGWLLFTGRFGCGKTHLAGAIANRRLKSGQAAIFVVVPDLLDHLRTTFGPNSEASYDELFDEVRRTELLILDDLGAHSATPWAQEKLFQILNHRYNSRLPTVLTTNQRLEELDQRLRSRLQDMDLVKRIPITAPDFRVGANEGQGGLSTLSFHAGQTFTSLDLQRPNTGHQGLSSLRNAFKAAEEFVDNPHGWLVLIGSSGAGKTHLAAAISNAWRALGQDEIMFVVVPDLLDHLRAAFNPQSPIPYDRRFDELKRTHLLVLDDLGTESATPWAREKLYQLLNYRYNAMLPTVITTRIEQDMLEPWLRTRIRDRSRCQVLPLKTGGYGGGAVQGGPGSSLLKQEEPDPKVWRE